MKISAAKFKAKCLKIMDSVNTYHEEVIITKHDKPVAKLIPYSLKPGKSIFGYLKNSVRINGGIIDSIDDTWDADR